MSTMNDSRPRPMPSFGHALHRQLVMNDGESLGEKIDRQYRPEQILAPQKVSIEQFEADMRKSR